MFSSSRHGSLSVIGSTILLILFLENALAATIDTKVLVLGAGTAGISAAKKLSEKGVDFIILEGTNRIGGRVRDGKLGSKTVEYGANWLHDLSENPLWASAQKYGLSGSTDLLRDAIFLAANEKDKSYEAEDLIEIYETAKAKLPQVYAQQCKTTCDLSMRQALTLAGWPAPKTRLEQIVEFYMFDWSEVLPSERVGFYGYIQGYLDTDNEDKKRDVREAEQRDFIVTDQRGFAYLLRSIAGEYLRANDPRLRFNEVVTSIDYRRVNTAKVLVTTSSGNVYAADHVIVTFSNNVLTYGDVQFVPALPDSKLKALRLMPTSIYTKHFIDLGAKVIDRDAYIVMMHENANQDWRKNAAWQNLALLAPFNDTNAALVTNLAEQGYDSSLLSSSAAIDFIVNGGSDVYPDLAELDKSRMVETHHCWANDRFARGSFATPLIGIDATVAANLKASLNGRVHFAGDGSQVEDYGSLASAFNSGLAAAGRVLTALSTNA